MEGAAIRKRKIVPIVNSDSVETTMKQMMMSMVLGMLLATVPISIQQLDTKQVGEIYAHLSSLTIDARRRAYSEVEGSMKAKLWLLHLTLFELNRNLTDDQSAFIAEVKTWIKGKNFDTQRDEVIGQAAYWQARSIALFGKDEARRLIADIGGEKLTAKQ